MLVPVLLNNSSEAVKRYRLVVQSVPTVKETNNQRDIGHNILDDILKGVRRYYTLHPQSYALALQIPNPPQITKLQTENINGFDGLTERYARNVCTSSQKSISTEGRPTSSLFSCSSWSSGLVGSDYSSSDYALQKAVASAADSISPESSSYFGDISDTVSDTAELMSRTKGKRLSKTARNRCTMRTSRYDINDESLNPFQNSISNNACFNCTYTIDDLSCEDISNHFADISDTVSDTMEISRKRAAKKLPRSVRNHLYRRTVNTISKESQAGLPYFPTTKYQFLTEDITELGSIPISDGRSSDSDLAIDITQTDFDETSEEMSDDVESSKYFAVETWDNVLATSDWTNKKKYFHSAESSQSEGNPTFLKDSEKAMDETKYHNTENCQGQKGLKIYFSKDGKPITEISKCISVKFKIPDSNDQDQRKSKENLTVSEISDKENDPPLTSSLKRKFSLITEEYEPAKIVLNQLV